MAVVLWSITAPAQDAAAIFKGKTVDIYTGYTVGGGYDLYTRLLARHIGRYLPGNPTVVPKNMEGAASIRFANWLYNVAPRTAPLSAPSAAALHSILCWDSPAPSSTARNSTGSAAPMTR
jgi:hypothetical protein